jgi:aminoglycoside phosphotransferase
VSPSGWELIKVAGTDSADFADEARRLGWAARNVTVPRVLGVGVDDNRAWLCTAVATLSLGWNYPGRELEAELFNAYGVESDRLRIDYYRRLWQA